LNKGNRDVEQIEARINRLRQRNGWRRGPKKAFGFRRFREICTAIWKLLCSAKILQLPRNHTKQREGLRLFALALVVFDAVPGG
jgi:hypothetical protein